MSDKKFELSRRNALIGLGTVGLASAGAGVGTSAYFSDEESFEDNELVAGELDLFVDYETSVYQGGVDTTSNGNQSNPNGTASPQNGTINGVDSVVGGSGTVTGDGAVSKEYEIYDVKPGDSGYLKFCPKIVDNPAWLWVGADNVSESENGQTEPEAEVDTSANIGELAESIQVDVYYCAEGTTMPIGDPEVLPAGVRQLNNPDDYTLEDLLLELQTGFPIDGDQPGGNSDLTAYPGSPDSSTQNGPCLCIEWEVPTGVENEIQTDSVGFDIVFAAVQERHNPNTESPFADTSLSTDYFTPSGHNNSTDGTVTTMVSFGDQTIAVSHTFMDDDDGLDFLDTSDYSQTNVPMAIDSDTDGTVDFQLAWQPSETWPDDPFAYINHPNSSTTDAPSALPQGFSAVKTGNTITYGIPRSVVGSQFRMMVFASTGGAGPVVEIDQNANDGNFDFFDSSNHIEVSE